MSKVRETKQFAKWTTGICPHYYEHNITRQEYIEPGTEYSQTGSIQHVKGKLKKALPITQLGLLYDDFIYGGSVTLYEDNTFTITYKTN